MACTAARVCEVPALDQVPVIPAAAACAAPATGRAGPGRFSVIGHRGMGMNALVSMDRRMRAVKENTIASFNLAAGFPVDFVEFDVQVTKDEYPIIFHDIFLVSEEEGKVSERRVTDLSIEEFLMYGPQKVLGKLGKPLLRKTKDGRFLKWSVEVDDSFCTLKEAFQNVDSHVGFNIELKFDDNLFYTENELTRVLQTVLRVVFECSNKRPVIFSSFQPDAARLVRELQDTYPVLFLTNGGTETYTDVRRNSLDEAIKMCMASGLQGIVSEAKAIFKNPSTIPRIKDSNLVLLTYGQLNNVPEAVYMQHIMGVNGVIVDLVKEITEAIPELIVKLERVLDAPIHDSRPKFSEGELRFLLKLIPELVQH